MLPKHKFWVSYFTRFGCVTHKSVHYRLQACIRDTNLCVTHPNLWPGSNKRCSKGSCAIRKKGGRQYTSIKMNCWFNVREVCVGCTCKESPFRELRWLVWSTLWHTLEPLRVAHNKPVLATVYCRVRCLSPLCTSSGSRFRELKVFPHLDFTLRQTFGAPSASSVLLRLQTVLWRVVY
jgi:hypothetical protein